MGSIGGDGVVASGNHGTDGSQTTVEIKIKTLDSKTYTLRVDKCVPVPELKEQVACVTGVVSDQQRLLCRGRVLKDDELLSAYHVEDGHTLHLVVRIPPTPDGLLNYPATDNASRVGSGLAGFQDPDETFDFAELVYAVNPDFDQMVEDFLSSMGVRGSGDEVHLMEFPQERLFRTSGLSGLGHSSSWHSHQASVRPQRPSVVPDSLTTLFNYLAGLRREFDRGNGNNLPIGGTHRSSAQNSSASYSAGRQSVFATLSSLVDAMLSTRQMLTEQAADCLSDLVRQLQNQANVTEPSARMSLQMDCLRSGALLQNLGSLLLELGRATTTLQLGQTPADAVVNAGPPVYISTSGPNPMMVQAFPPQPETSFHATPVEITEVTRTIQMRMRTGPLIPSGTSAERESNSLQAFAGQMNPVDGANFVNQASTAVPATSFFVGVPEVQLVSVPVRTVVAGVPAPVRHTSSDSFPSSMGSSRSVLATLHINPGVLNRHMDSQFSREHGTSEPVTAGPGVNFRRGVTNSMPNGAASNVQDATPRVDTLASHLLHQMMPFTPRSTAERESTNREVSSTQASQTDVGTSTRRRASGQPADSSTPCPSNKRQKRQQ